MDLIEYSSEERLRREAVAGKLRELADELSRHNEVPFVREGVRYAVKVPAEVTYTIEIEVGESSSEIEIEISW